jgi:hypothetical protein
MLVGSSKLMGHGGVSTLAKHIATSLHLGQAHGYFFPLGLGRMDTTPLGLGCMDTLLYTPSAV